MRKPIVAGNWKMNMTPSEGVRLVEELKKHLADTGAEVIICVPAIDVQAVGGAIEGSAIKLGAQNVHYAASGAFTGEISVKMLTELKVEYVIVGHSERRKYFGDTNETVNKRAIAALNGGLKPIVCVGESLEERREGKTFAVLEKALSECFAGIDDYDDTVIAYEPYWAIGTGITPTLEEIEEVAAYLRSTVAKLYGAGSAEKVRILYGGSVNAANAGEILKLPNVDGGLIGGESLKPEKFAEIAEQYNK